MNLKNTSVVEQIYNQEITLFSNEKQKLLNSSKTYCLIKLYENRIQKGSKNYSLKDCLSFIEKIDPSKEK